MRKNDIIATYGGEEFASIRLITDKQQADQAPDLPRVACHRASASGPSGLRER